VHQDIRFVDENELRPQSQEASGLSTDFSELTGVVGRRGGSRVMGGLSASGLVNVAVGDWLTISRLLLAIIAIGADHLLRSSCYFGFRASLVDATISELKLEVEDRDGCSVPRSTLKEAAALQWIRLTGYIFGDLPIVMRTPRLSIFQSQLVRIHSISALRPMFSVLTMITTLIAYFTWDIHAVVRKLQRCVLPELPHSIRF
jgi:hypothetical protein